MGLFHVVYNGYVCKTLFPYRHPERSRGIFLAYWYSAVCETAEKGKPFAKGARNDGVQGRFLAVLEMTVWGNGFISRSVQRICLESAIPVSSSRAKSRDQGDNVVCVIAEKGKPFAKGARKSRVQGRFLAALEMTAWGWISAVSYKVCAGKRFFPNRHPERSRGIFFVGGKRASVRQRGTGNTASQERKRSLLQKPSIYLFP